MGELPKTDFQTVIDSVVLSTMYTLALSCFIAMWAARSLNSGDEEKAERINAWGVPGLTLLYFLALFVRVVPMMIKKRWAKASLLGRAGASNVISEGVQEHLHAIVLDPKFGMPDWLQENQLD